MFEHTIKCLEGLIFLDNYWSKEDNPNKDKYGKWSKELESAIKTLQKEGKK